MLTTELKITVTCDTCDTCETLELEEIPENLDDEVGDHIDWVNIYGGWECCDCQKNDERYTAARASFDELWQGTCDNDPNWIGDDIARRCAWCDYVDGLQKDGEISEFQADNWDNPY